MAYAWLGDSFGKKRMGRGGVILQSHACGPPNWHKENTHLQMAQSKAQAYFGQALGQPF